MIATTLMVSMEQKYPNLRCCFFWIGLKERVRRWWHGICFFRLKPSNFTSKGFYSMNIPVKTIKAYKLFRVKGGNIFPLYIYANEAIPVGVWQEAKIGPVSSDGKKVKSKLGKLAMRPGWHGSDYPAALHIGGKDKGFKHPNYRKNDEVWAEVEFSADIDWQPEAISRASLSKTGAIIASTAHITDSIPKDGFYRYKNPNACQDWIIAGSMRVNRILPDDEVFSINCQTGVHDLPRKLQSLVLTK